MSVPNGPDPSTLGRPRLRVLDYFTLNIYWFALSFLWNSMGPILLPTLVPQLVPESQKGSALGLITAIGLIVAIVVQPLAGEFTDRHVSRWGRRRPYILVGTLGDVVFLSVMALSGNFWLLLVAYVLLQTFSNIAHGPYQAYIPDLIPVSKRGAVTGIKQLVEILGIIVTSLAVGNLISGGQVIASFVAIIVILVITMIITVVGIREVPFAETDQAAAVEHADAEADAKTQVLSKPLVSGIIASIVHQRDFALWLLSRFLILAGGNLVRNYALYFLGDVLKLPNPAAEVGNLLAIIAVAIAVVVYPAGVLSDRIGRKRLVVFSGVLGAAGALLLVSANSLTMVLLDGAVIGVSIGIFLSVNWAWAVDLIPAGSGGRYLGISNLATAGSGVFAGLGGVILDVFNAQSSNMGYPVLYMAAAACYALGTLVALAVKEGGAKAKG